MQLAIHATANQSPANRARAKSIAAAMPNYMRYMHDGGVQRGSRVLVVGQIDDDALRALAKLVGMRGTITVVDSDRNALQHIQASTKAAAYKTFQPQHSVHPAFDPRPNKARYQAVRIGTEAIVAADLSFDSEHFDVVWVASLPQAIGASDHATFHQELLRVTKTPGRVVFFNAPHGTTDGRTQYGVSIEINYKC